MEAQVGGGQASTSRGSGGALASHRGCLLSVQIADSARFGKGVVYCTVSKHNLKNQNCTRARSGRESALTWISLHWSPVSGDLAHPRAGRHGRHRGGQLSTCLSQKDSIKLWYEARSGVSSACLYFKLGWVLSEDGLGPVSLQLGS